MPNRILREGIIDSAAVNSLTDSGEILYRRLMSITDDFGRFEHKAALIRARCFPLQLNRWSEERVEECLSELRCGTVENGEPALITVYSVGNKKYLQINNFGQREQAKPKHPGPDSPLATVENREPRPRATRARSESESESESNAHTKSLPRIVRAPLVTDLNGRTSSRFPEFWEKYPMKVERDAASREFISVVMVENEQDVFACLARYLASDQVARGVVSKAAGWLQQQYRDKWSADWPKAKPIKRENGIDAALDKWANGD